MLNLTGQNLKETLDAIRPELTALERTETIANANQIVSAIVETYNSKIKNGEVGQNGTGPVGEVQYNSSVNNSGLVYGRIQSGKTRAMITSTALAFDNKFQIVVVITSNNNRLVGQTCRDFQNGLPGSIRVYSKDHFKTEVDHAKSILTSGNGGIVLVCSKGATRLEQVIEFLESIEAKEYPSLIFDDEGDQATLDTNSLKRSTTDPLIPPSKIHGLIHDSNLHSLREALPRNIFVSVTGTPSGIVLQNIDNQSRPSFIELLKAGGGYVGGETFFSEPIPTSNNKLISLINENERMELLSGEINLPEGLKEAIRLFLLAAAAASKKISWPTDDTGYKFLCHPSVKMADQKKVDKLIRSYLIDLTGAFKDKRHHLYNELKNYYDSLKLQTPDILDIDSLLEVISNYIPSREILLLNSNTTGNDLNYSKYFNFLIGGNTLGRGLAIKSLLVTYYVREAKTTQMDTMYQHARMFGYRKATLPYTRVFLPPQLYERFYQIYISDEELRNFIEEHKNSTTMLPVRIAKDIKATRGCVLDSRKINVLIPGKQIYPNYPYFNALNVDIITNKIHEKIVEIFPEYKDRNVGREGKIITTEQAKNILSLVKTNGTNIWNDKKMPLIISYLGQQFPDGMILKYRKATRSAGDSKGLLAQGVLAGDDVTKDSNENVPVLWIFDLTFKPENKPVDWNETPFIYPTLVLPKTAELVVYNRS